MVPWFGRPRETPVHAPYGVMAMLAVVLTLWFQYAMYILLVGPEFASRAELLTQLGLIVGLGVVYFVWMALWGVRRVGLGSGAGFRLALVGLAARIQVTMLVWVVGGDTFQSIYVTLPQSAGPIWWVRQASLFAYGFGLALVVLSSAVDIARRRRQRFSPTILASD